MSEQSAMRPTVNEVIERVERIKPVVNVDDRDKAAWLIELDNRIWNELVRKSREQSEAVPVRVWPEDGDKPLLVPVPYDRVYDLYLIAMLEFALREYNNYNNTMQAFNYALDLFSCWYRSVHMPASAGEERHLFP